MKAEMFFSKREKDEIAAAIRNVEDTTAGEVAVMIVDRSDSYPEAAIIGGLMTGTVAALAITDLLFADSLWHFIPLAIVLSAVFGWLIVHIPAVQRFFIPAARAEENVRDRAIRAFYEKGLYQTRDDTGVLFYISLLEHKVWVLADRGIYGRISQDELQAYAGRVAAGIKQGKAADALCREISEVGRILAAYFPRREDDINELSNRVLFE